MSWFLEHLIKNAVQVDFESEILYGSDQAYVSVPRRFATVSFELEATPALVALADKARAKFGLTPLSHGIHYDFYFGLNDFSESKVDSYISVFVYGVDLVDDGQQYALELDEAEQKMLYSCLDDQFRHRLLLSCEDLLEEARKRLD